MDLMFQRELANRAYGPRTNTSNSGYDLPTPGRDAMIPEIHVSQPFVQASSQLSQQAGPPTLIGNNSLQGITRPYPLVYAPEMSSASRGVFKSALWLDLRDKSSGTPDVGFTGSHFRDQSEQAAAGVAQEDEITLNSPNAEEARDHPQLSFSIDKSATRFSFAPSDSHSHSRVGSQNYNPRPSEDRGGFADHSSASLRRLRPPTKEDGRGRGSASTTSLGTSDSFVQITPQQSSPSSRARTPGSKGVISLGTISVRKPSPGASTLGYHSNDNSHGSPLAEVLRHIGPRRNWDIPAKPKRGRKSQPKATKQHSQVRKHATPNKPKTRYGRTGPLKSNSLQNYRLVRRRGGACTPCRYKKCLCYTDPRNPDSACQGCSKTRPKELPCLIDPSNPCRRCGSCVPINPTIDRPLCFRYDVTDVSLYREQNAPYQLFTKRWPSMAMIDIPDSDWASGELRSIDVSQNFVDAPYTVQVRQFIPRDGDMLAEMWHDDNGNERRFPVPPYAIANMADAAESIRKMIHYKQHLYLYSLLKYRSEDHGGDFLWETYLFAFRYPDRVKDELIRSLITKTFSLWVACRLTSYPESIVGSETLGLPRRVTDPSSPWKDRYPTPPVMGAQLECILYTTFLRPLSDDVRTKLHELLRRKRTHEVWMTVYLCVLVLLHSCAMLTRRDKEYARQINLGAEYANPDAIKHHQKGAIILLAHYHTIVGGPVPFRHAGEGRLAKNRKNWEFTEEQEVFLKDTYMRTTLMQPEFRKVRLEGDLSNEWYWISQLFDENWTPDLLD